MFARTVVETKTYESQRDAIIPNVQRFDEIMRGVYWALATQPEAYPPISPNSSIHVLKTDAFSDIPRMRIYYRFDDSNTHLLWIELI
jgi:hypothetical protein